MNTKKAVWIGRPEKLRTTLHSFEFDADSSNSVFFTLGEEGTIDLTKKGNAESAFILLHTPSDFVLFRSESIKLSFSGIEAVQSAQDIQKSRLSRAGFSENEDKAAVGKAEVDPFEGLDRFLSLDVICLP